jgi:hypothetical protein
LASGVREQSPVGPAALWAGGIVVGLVAAFVRPSKAPSPVRNRHPVPGGGGGRSPADRVRGRNRRRPS